MSSPRLYVEVINLTRDHARRDRMRAELAQAGLEAAFHPAFDMHAHRREEMLAYCREEGPWGVLQDGNMAITISHAQVWERFLASDAALCLVLEDDVFLAKELGQWAQDLSWWPEDADIVKIERWRGRSLKVLLSANAQRYKGRRIARLLSRHVGAAGYILTRAAAERLLASKPFDITIDNLLFNFNASRVLKGLRVYQVTPALVEQGNEPAELHHKTTPKKRPEGWQLVRQKLRRGYYELAYPLPTLLRFVTGRARLERIAFSADAVTETPL